jgi:hypothetical protein
MPATAAADATHVVEGQGAHRQAIVLEVELQRVSAREQDLRALLDRGLEVVRGVAHTRRIAVLHPSDVVGVVAHE